MEGGEGREKREEEGKGTGRGLPIFMDSRYAPAVSVQDQDGERREATSVLKHNEPQSTSGNSQRNSV